MKDAEYGKQDKGSLHEAPTSKKLKKATENRELALLQLWNKWVEADLKIVSTERITVPGKACLTTLITGLEVLIGNRVCSSESMLISILGVRIVL